MNYCGVCKKKSEKLFEGKILGKHSIDYFRCPSCGFIQTEKPFWLEDAYSDAIALLDVGLVWRNIDLLKPVSRILIDHFDYRGRFLDYAGGYGLFVRLMRDRGFDFYWQDQYCENIFSKFFGLDDLPKNTKFEAVTAFEVLEHCENPHADIEKMLRYSDTILFSTQLVPDPTPRSIDNWWYFSPLTGQHISFFTKKSLEHYAQELGCTFYTSDSHLHILTKRVFRTNPLLSGYKKGILNTIRKKLIHLLKRRDRVSSKGLLKKDYNFTKSKISGQQEDKN